MNIYETITTRILNQLDAGHIPWRKTWAAGLPRNLTSNKEYRGVNTLVLAASGFTSRFWVTYREAQRLGGQVRKGEKATPVIFWKWRSSVDMEKLKREHGAKDFAPCVPFLSFVFNLDQVDGLQSDCETTPQPIPAPYEIANLMLETMPNPPQIHHAAHLEPAYHPQSDMVVLPHLSQFESGTEYYATLFHELAHATGHATRLNRFSTTPGDRVERYSFEELVAEFCAAFLCAHTSINNPTSEALHASYIASWSKVLRLNPQMILRAASLAQRAADYIRGKVHAEDLTIAA